jgi:hypothetical protein
MAMHSTLFTRLSVLVTALGLLAVLASPASAAPTNAKPAELIELPCANGAVYTIATIGNGAFTPGHILDAEGRILIPVTFHFVVTNESGDVLFDDTAAKPGQMSGLSGDLIECTFTETETDPETGETVTITGTVTLFVTPRG